MQATKKELASELGRLCKAGALSVAPYLRSVARTIPTYETKRDLHDPVTEHDRFVESSLRRFFGSAVPESLLLGEEMGEEVLSGDPKQRVDEAAGHLGSRVRWIADPLDGTANFAAGSIYFGTSVAAELDGEVVAGAITIPCTEEVFYADLEGAWYQQADDVPRPLTCSGPNEEAEALLVSYYPGRWSLENHPDLSLEHLTALTKNFMVVRRTGASALDLAQVAAGWQGALLGTSFGPWDVAAGIHLVKMAGGSVLNLSYRADNLPEGLRPALLATAGSLDAPTGRKVLREAVAAAQG